MRYRTETDPLSVAADLVEVYADVFREAPYHEGPDQVREFAELYDTQARQPGFHLVTAQDSARLVGFAYGDSQPPEWWWRDADRRPPRDVEAAAKFAVFEWAVLPSYQCQGIGRTLLARLFDGRDEPWATLTVNPEAKAYAIYRGSGWQHIGTNLREGWPPMAIMLRELYVDHARAGTVG